MLHSPYEERVERFNEELASLSQTDRNYNRIRLLVFLAILALIILAFNYHIALGILLLYFGVFGFYKLVQKHNRIKAERQVIENIRNLNQAEILHSQNDFSPFDEGLRYQESLHPYSGDLDVFGQQSLFQKICRATTTFGKDQLAHLLTTLLDRPDILTYQSAVRSLVPQIDWRQRLYALGKTDLSDENLHKRILEWSIAKRELKVPYWVLILVPLFCCAAFVGLLFYLPWQLAFLSFVPTIWLSIKNKSKIDTIYNSLGPVEHQLLNYSRIIQYIEDSTFEDPHLQSLQEKYASTARPASESISSLSYALKQLELRNNFFAIFFQIAFLWDHYWANKIENWKDDHGAQIQEWISALGEYEVLSSLSTLSYNHPSWTTPTISDVPLYSAKDLGHPLIADSASVRNDFSMSTQRHVKIVTGSNMGGKSTFLRTVALNIVLARCGSVCCATDISLPLLDLISSMRTEDDLSENTSSFYAELQRLKQVIETVKETPSTMFFLDEILKGTNSNDRHKGARALIKQLLSSNGTGLISTHDLELGLMAEDHADEIENICFEVEVQDDQLTFDYKLKKGISQSFNATQLMRSIGIEV